LLAFRSTAARWSRALRRRQLLRRLPSPTTALAAACALQQALLSEPWPPQTPLRVRMALHVAPAALRGGDYYGPGAIRYARMRAVGHGGQVLLSSATAERVREVSRAVALLEESLALAREGKIASVAGDDLHAGMLPQPLRQRLGPAVREQVEDATAL